MRQLRSAVLPPLDLTKAGLGSTTFGKPNALSDCIPSAARSIELGYFPHLLRSTGGPTPSSSRLASHSDNRPVPASASATTYHRFNRKETPYTDGYDKPLASPEKRQKHTCGYQQLEVLRKKLVNLEQHNEVTQNHNPLAEPHAKAAPSALAPTTYLVPTAMLPSKLCMTVELGNMEPFSTTPEFFFSVEETWDGISETSLVYEGQTIPVEATLEDELEEGRHLHQFVKLRQKFDNMEEELF